MRMSLGKILLASSGIVVALMLIPGDRDPKSTTSTPVLSTSPELASFLDNAVAPSPAAKTPEQVIAEVAAAPEPGAPVKGLELPTDPEITGSISVTSTPVGPRELTSVRAPVNMRAGPSTSYATLFVLQPDEQVTILSRDGSWTQIEKTNGATGWVYSRYLGTGGGVDEPRSDPVASAPVREASVDAEERPRKTVKVVRDDGAQLAGIRLRASPSNRAPQVYEVEPGTPLRVAQRRGSWLRVVLPNGVSGWVKGR